MAQETQTVTSMDRELLKMLKKDDKGWNIALFHNTIKITTCLCHHCNSVCCDAVELGCNHDDNDIYTHCKQCLCDLIDDSDGFCPINNHKNPIIAAARSLRRQISNSIVFCPYSANYKSQQHQHNYPNVIDTNGADEGKEGILLGNKETNCGWKGTLNDLLHSDHLKQCAISNDPSFFYKQKIRNLEQQRIKSMTELKIKLDIANDKNQQLQLQIDDLVEKQGITNNINQSLQTMLNEQVANNQQLSQIIEKQKQEIFQLKQNDDQKAKDNVDININDMGEDEWTQWSDPNVFVQFVRVAICERIEPTRSILLRQKLDLADKQLTKYLDGLALIQRNLVQFISQGHDKQSLIATAVDFNDCIVGTIQWFNHLVRLSKNQTDAFVVSDDLKWNADLYKLTKKIVAI